MLPTDTMMNGFVLARRGCLRVCNCASVVGFKAQGLSPLGKKQPPPSHWIIKPSFEESLCYYLFTCLSQMIHEKREYKEEARDGFHQA